MPDRKNLPQAAQTALVLLLAALLFAAVWLLQSQLQLDSLHRLAEVVVSTGVWGPLVIIILQVLAGIAGVIPSTPLTILAGIVWGTWTGLGISLVGMQLGAVAAFLISRSAVFPWVDRYLESHARLYRSISDAYVTRFVFLARLLPFFLFELVSYGAGLTRIRFWKYFWATLLGMIPLQLLLVWTGEASLEQGGFWVWLVTGLSIALVIAAPYIVERYNPFDIKRWLTE